MASACYFSKDKEVRASVQIPKSLGRSDPESRCCRCWRRDIRACRWYVVLLQVLKMLNLCNSQYSARCGAQSAGSRGQESCWRAHPDLPSTGNDHEPGSEVLTTWNGWQMFLHGLIVIIHGISWIHGIDGNPLYDLVPKHNLHYLEKGQIRSPETGQALPQESTDALVETLWSLHSRMVTASRKMVRDISLKEFIQRDEEWNRAIERVNIHSITYATILKSLESPVRRVPTAPDASL